MNLFERRQQLERLFQALQEAPTEGAKRRAIFEALEVARAEGAQEMTLIATAATIAAGGSFTTPGAVFAELPAEGGLEIVLRPDTGALTVTLRAAFSPVQQLLIRLTNGRPVYTDPVPAAEAPADYPPANLDESDDLARVRICEAVKRLTQRHYRGEFESRGFAWVSTVFGELLAMALGIERAHLVDPPLADTWLDDFTRELLPRVERYQRVTETLRAATDAARPGDSTRLH